jgi:hypothetical protein
MTFATSRKTGTRKIGGGRQAVRSQAVGLHADRQEGCR